MLAKPAVIVHLDFRMSYTWIEAANTVEAGTVQAFMISSVFSKNKDVAALQPVKNLDT